ncbi:MAG: hypothetical protein EPO24_10610 [Bacteroidetes bacterium]|nr:MAG: hypothetical protein EPO24_10610 [Bacteroidota bacterium]
MNIVIYSVVAVTLFLSNVYGQDVRISARVDSNNIMIGDWLGLHIEVQRKANTAVSWPQIADSLDGIEIVKRGDVQTRNSGSDVLEKLDYIITSFDSGTVVVPPLQFLYSVAGDTAKRVAESSPIPIFVHTMEVDTSQDIKDVKPPLSLPITFAELLPYILALLGIAGLGWLFYYVWNKRRKGESLIPEAPKRPAHEIALEALRSLDSEHLWQRGKIKEHYSMLTDIVRAYIENRFRVMALEMVTDEIMSAPVIRSLEKDAREPLRELLVLSDFVKFAKLQPTPKENESSIGIARQFVERTWHRVEEEQAPQQAEEVTA